MTNIDTLFCKSHLTSFAFQEPIIIISHLKGVGVIFATKAEIVEMGPKTPLGFIKFICYLESQAQNSQCEVHKG